MLITLTTDFGPASRYVAQMKGVLCTRAPGASLVDLSHSISPQNIATAARLLAQAAPWYPPATVHLVVVDPGVGADRRVVAVEAIGQRFVGPDNGLFGWLADHGELRAVELDRERLDCPRESATFHGRDLMAPAAAALASGAELTSLGELIESVASLPTAPGPARSETSIACRVVEIDRYGNVITDLHRSAMDGAPTDDRLRVALGEHETLGLWRTYGDQPPQTLLALVGSDGFVELAITNGNAAEMLDARVGDTVLLDWEPSA